MDPLPHKETGELSTIGWWMIGTAGVVAFVVLLGLVYLGVSSITESLKTKDGLNSAAYSEWTAASADHSVIVEIAALCKPTASSLAVSDRILRIFPNGSMDVPASTRKEPPSVTLDTPSYLLSALTLSNDIGRLRIEQATQKTVNYVWMEVLQWMLVAVVAITTILISIKSMSTVRTHAYFAIGVAAIIFSALGTAIAGLNSFYLPRTAYLSSSHSLTSLRTLHLQLAAGITRQGQMCTAMKWPPDWRLTRIKAIADQYAAILNAVESGGTTSDSAIPSTPEGDTTPKPPAPPGGVSPRTGR